MSFFPLYRMELFRGRRTNFMSDPHDDLHRLPTVTTTEPAVIGLPPGAPDSYTENMGIYPLDADEIVAEGEPNVVPLNPLAERPAHKKKRVVSYPLWNPGPQNEITSLFGRNSTIENLKTFLLDPTSFKIEHMQAYTALYTFSATKDEYETFVDLDLETQENLNKVVRARIDKCADRMIDRFIVKDRSVMIVGQRVRVNESAEQNKCEMQQNIAKHAKKKMRTYHPIPPKWSKDVYTIHKIAEEVNGKPYYMVTRIFDSFESLVKYDAFDLYPVQGLKAKDIVRVDLSFNASYKRMFGAIIKNRFARWTTTLYQIDYVTMGERPPKQHEKELDPAFQMRYDAWKGRVLKNTQVNPANDPHQAVHNTQHDMDLVEEGLIPQDVVSLYWVQVLEGEKGGDERDPKLRRLPLHDEQVMYVGEGKTQDEIKKTVSQINRIQFMSVKKRPVLDFKYFLDIQEKNPNHVSIRTKGLKFGRRGRSELALLFNSRQDQINNMDLFVQSQEPVQEMNTRNTTQQSREQTRAIAGRTRSKGIAPRSKASLRDRARANRTKRA